MGAVWGWGWGFSVCTAEQDRGDEEKSLLAGGLGKDQRREGFPQAEVELSRWKKEHGQRKGRCGSGEVGLANREVSPPSPALPMPTSFSLRFQLHPHLGCLT